MTNAQTLGLVLAVVGGGLIGTFIVPIVGPIGFIGAFLWGGAAMLIAQEILGE